jgi:hypothetical protein
MPPATPSSDRGIFRWLLAVASKSSHDGLVLVERWRAITIFGHSPKCFFAQAALQTAAQSFGKRTPAPGTQSGVNAILAQCLYIRFQLSTVHFASTLPAIRMRFTALGALSPRNALLSRPV